MTMDAGSKNPKPQWDHLATQLEKLGTAPSSEQVRVAGVIGVALPSDIPAPVAAVIIRVALSEALLESRNSSAEIPTALYEIEDELGITAPAKLLTGSRDEVSAWFAARYMLKSAIGLRRLRPKIGDVVKGRDPNFGERVISSISSNGRIFMKGRPPRSAWPNNLDMVSRVGELDHKKVVLRAEAKLLNAHKGYSSSSSRFEELEEFELDTCLPSPEAVRELEELLESGERNEAPFQKLLERSPQLLASVVIGNWSTYVIPQARLGSEHVTDFLVLGLNSLGPQWVAVEIEAPRHKLSNLDGSLPVGVRHAIKQIEDWREWLTLQVAYAQGGSRAERTGLGLHGITNRAPGLVIIGRGDPTSARQASRSLPGETAGIVIHSWDWLLRHAKATIGNVLHASDFAIANADDLVGEDIMSETP